MKVKRHLLAVARVLLRLGLVLVLLVEFSFPHSAMTHHADKDIVSMAQAMPMHSQMNHKGGHVADMDGALCAILSVGTDRVEGNVLASRVIAFRSARWIRAASLRWLAPTPNPALRPPDMVLNT